jgi:hypothetical protein
MFQLRLKRKFSFSYFRFFRKNLTKSYENNENFRENRCENFRENENVRENFCKHENFRENDHF